MTESGDGVKECSRVGGVYGLLLAFRQKKT